MRAAKDDAQWQHAEKRQPVVRFGEAIDVARKDRADRLLQLHQERKHGLVVVPLGLNHRERDLFVVISGTEAKLRRELVRFGRSHSAAQPVMIAGDRFEIKDLGVASPRYVDTRTEPFGMPGDTKLHTFAVGRIDDLQQPIRQSTRDLDRLGGVVLITLRGGCGNPNLR